MKLSKPIKINSNLENGGHLSCGVNSIASILYTLGYTDINLENLNKDLESLDKEIKFGGVYKIELLIHILDFISREYDIDISYEVKEFSTAEEFRNILKNENKYAIVCYYALQGFVRVSKHPSMEHAHFGIIYEYNEESDTISGSQSNSKADMLKCLENVDINKFVESCNIVNKLKLNWGKYNKCDINISKKELEDRNRCGEDFCKLGLCSISRCIYKPTIGNKVIFIG